VGNTKCCNTHSTVVEKQSTHPLIKYVMLVKNGRVAIYTKNGISASQKKFFLACELALT